MSDPDDPKKEPIKDSSLRSCLIILVGWIVVLVMVASMAAFVVLKPGVKDQVSMGPDEDGATSVFEQRFGFPPPTSVSHIYYGNYWKRRSPVFIVRFTYSDDKVVDKIILGLGLKPTEKLPPHWISNDRPVWWPSAPPTALSPGSDLTGDQYIRAAAITWDHFNNATDSELVDVWVDRKERIVFYMKSLSD
jgi:hypothetical protein